MVAMRDPKSDRLNMLLSDRGQQWASQLPCLLEPQGVRTLRADSVTASVKLIHRDPIHIAVIDMALPMQVGQADPQAAAAPGGICLLKEIRRLAQRPRAIVAVRDRRFDPRIDDPILIEALKLNVFSVLDEPVEIEQILGVLRRALERHYQGRWPAEPPRTQGDAQ